MTGTAVSQVETYPPVVTHGAGNEEALKYGKLWAMDEYRAYAPGEHFALNFLMRAEPKKGATVIDYGCGTGRGALALANLAGMNVTMLDFVRNCLDKEVQEQVDSGKLKFFKTDLEALPSYFTSEFGYCTDVCEHIPTDKIDRVLNSILRASKFCWFSICLVDDSMGKLIGETLHLTVKSFEWWEEKFKSRECTIIWSEHDSVYAHFYVTAWQDGQEVVNGGELNVTTDTVFNNVKANCEGTKWMQVSPHDENDLEVMIVGGGPSLNGMLDEIKQQRENGVKLVTLNGAYNWALAHDLVPSAQIVVDARPFNARFTHPVVEGCKYLIGSQCDPSVLEGLPEDRTYLWHTAAENIEPILKETYSVWWPILGGSTGLLRGIPLLRLLGFKKFHLYGCDSSLNVTSPEGEDLEYTHHAYGQPENDSKIVVPVVVKTPVHGGFEKVFYCHLWMVAQAQEFISMIRQLGEHIEIQVHGEGLLKYILDAGAEAANILKIGEGKFDI